MQDFALLVALLDHTYFAHISTLAALMSFPQLGFFLIS
jgi:hypothetical protein